MSRCILKDQDPLLSRREAANLLGVKEATLAVWHSTGRFNIPVVKVGSLAKYKLSDIQKFLNKRVTNPPARDGNSMKEKDRGY